MTLSDLLSLCFVASLVIGFLVIRATLRFARRASVRMEHQLERRLVDIALGVILFRWLRRRHAAHVVRPPALEGDAMFRACELSTWQGDPAACRWCNGMLPDRSRRFCRPQCSRAARENHWFNGEGGARAAALYRDGYRCRRAGCGAEATTAHALEVHHLTACHGRHDVPGCWHHLDGLLTLCHRHHAIETQRQLAAGEFGHHPGRIWA